MAVDTAKSTSSTVSQAIKNRYYDKLFLRVAQSKLLFKQVGQVNRNIEQGAGGYGTGAVFWTRWTNLNKVTAGQGEGIPTTAVSLTATNVTGTTAQYDAAVSISDILAYTSFSDVMKSAMELLAYNAGLSIDSIIANTVSLSGTRQNATGLAAAATTAIPVTGTLTIGEIKKSVRTLRRNDAMEQSDGFFVSVIHPDALYDLMVDSSTGGWIDANKYTEPNAENLMKGEVGKIAGVRFVESTNAPVAIGTIAGSGLVASSSLYVTNVFARDAFGVTELQNLKTYVKDFSSGGTGDPTEKVATVGWKTTFGAAMLNASFYTNIVHTVSSTT